jgi:hypothetical protein
MTITNLMNVATANIQNIVISSAISSTANSLTANSVSFVATNNVYAANAIQTTNVLASNIIATSLTGTFYGPIVGSNTVSASGLYGPVVGSNTVSASTVTATSLVGTLYGPVVGSNTISASTIYGTIAGSNTIAGSTITGTFYGPVAGSNTIAASTVTATSLVGNLYGPVVGSNTIAASTVTATSLVGTHYGVIAGSNTIAASTVTATSLVGTFYGVIAGSNTIAASTVTATSLVGTFYGPVVGSNTVSASTLYGPIAGSNTIAASTVTATSLVGTFYGVIAGSNTIAASTVTATNLVGTFYGPIVGSNTIAASTVTATSLVGTHYGIIAGSNTIAGSSLTLGTALSIGNGGTGQTTKSAAFDALSPMTTLGDFVYGGASGTGTRLAPNSTATLKFLSETSSTPSWVTISATDLPSVTFSPGSSGTYGSAAAVPVLTIDTYGRITGVTTAAVSTLSGLTTNGVLYATSSSAVSTTSPGSAGQPLLSGGTLAAPAYGTLGLSYGGTGQTTKSAAFDALSPMTTLGDLIYGGASGTNSRLVGNTTATKNFLVQTGNGTVSGAPIWGTILAADVPTLNQNTTGTAGGLSGTPNITVGTVNAGAITSSQVALVGFKNIVNRQPLIGIGAFGAAMYFSTTSVSTYTTPLIGNIVYGPFSSSYGAGSVATGATRQYRMYAVWSDNIQATASSFQIIFNMANSTTITFSFGITNGDPANYRDGYSDTQTISNTNNASTISFSILNGVTGKATGGGNLSTANIRINYLELQAIDQY